MTDFHKLFIVKINKMIKKKTGASFVVFYIICGSLVYIDSKKTLRHVSFRMSRRAKRYTDRPFHFSVMAI